MLVVMHVAFRWLYISRFRFHCHGDNSAENVPNDRVAGDKKNENLLVFRGPFFGVNHSMRTSKPLTCSDVGAVFCVELFFIERFRLFGELFWYFDINKLAMISDNFSSKSWHQNLLVRMS